MMHQRTVLISGAGIAGPTLAFWLEQAGFQPTIVESAAALRTDGYVIDFWGLGYEIAELMGLTPEIGRIGYHMKELRIVDDHGRRISGFGTRVFNDLTGGRYITLPRSDLSRLAFTAAKHGEVESIFGDEIAALSERPDCVCVEFKHSQVRDFDLVIGADGLHSAVRNLVFGPEAQFERRLGYTVAAFEVSGYRPRDEDVYLMYGQPGRMVGRFTLHGDRSLFLFAFASSGPFPRTLERQKALLEEEYRSAEWECPHILDELARAHDLYFDSVSQIRMERWSRGRIALVGDAAFCVSLLAGQGSALAMTSAYVLAGELARAAGDHAIAFDRYESRLRDYVTGKQQGAERFAAAFAPRTRWGLWFRNQVIRAASIPGLARWAVGRDIVDKLDLPDYFPRA